MNKIKQLIIAALILGGSITASAETQIITKPVMQSVDKTVIQSVDKAVAIGNTVNGRSWAV
jgi:hypothetical protein